MLPTFYCIGAQKAGTTWLYDCLAEHPQVFVPEHKEVNWFRGWRGHPSPYASRGLEPYERLFDGAAGHLARGDVSPGLLAAGCAPTLRQLTPDAKILVMLRDPASRAHSHYHMLAGRGDLGFTFDELLADPDRPDPDGILDDGYYGKHLEPFLERFGRVEVLRFEDVARAPETLFARVCSVIGADPTVRPGRLRERSNAAGTYRWRAVYRARLWTAKRLAASPLDPLRVGIKRLGVPSLVERLFRRERPNPTLTARQRARLQEIYREDVSRLEALLGRRFDDWTTA